MILGVTSEIYIRNRHLSRENKAHHTFHLPASTDEDPPQFVGHGDLQVGTHGPEKWVMFLVGG